MVALLEDAVQAIPDVSQCVLADAGYDTKRAFGELLIISDRDAGDGWGESEGSWTRRSEKQRAESRLGGLVVRIKCKYAFEASTLSTEVG